MTAPRDAAHGTDFGGLPRLPAICSQCGEPFSERACGPTHAIVWQSIELPLRAALAGASPPEPSEPRRVERLRALIETWYDETEDADHDDGTSLATFLVRHRTLVADGVVEETLPPIKFARRVVVPPSSGGDA